MTIPTTALDETSPAGTQSASLGDNRIREYKTQNREILEVDHNYPSSGQDADAGKHKKVSLIEQSDIGSGAAGKPILGAQTVSGKAELTFTDEDDNDIQLSDNGYINLDAGRTNNDSYLKARNAAGTGDVNLIKASTGNIAVIPDGSQTATSAAPTADAGIANKKYVDDRLVSEGIQAWVKFDGSSGAVVDASYNVTSVSRTATGTYTITFTTAFANAHYAVAGSAADALVTINSGTTTASVLGIIVRDYSGTAANNARISVMCIGSQ